MVQQLLLKDQFKAVLEDYSLSEEAQRKLQDLTIALFDGPSASGCNTLMAKLVDKGNYQLFISDTTRHPRRNNGVLEQNGVEYWFKTEETFLAGLRNREYVEAALIHDQQVSGVNISEIDRIAQTNKIAINDVQPEGIKTFKKYKPDTICFFIIPPDLHTWLQRMERRGIMAPDEHARRLQSATAEIRQALHNDYYHFVINDDLDEAVTLVDAICQGTPADDSAARIQAQALLDSVVTRFG